MKPAPRCAPTASCNARRHRHCRHRQTENSAPIQIEAAGSGIPQEPGPLQVLNFAPREQGQDESATAAAR
ncbi:hypothetical protein HPB47_001947 [Ixodes persulcatus]|uniref:Uncharacterized protein n=1 Tax=Ixodes persulcatus TaxID=34615 RepID=A0AC60PMK0_IXOPE|nr:hypothetical protein HPB47_001947 [Ixodes persulcatus]